MIAIVLATPQEAAPLLTSVHTEQDHNAPFPVYRIYGSSSELILICGMGKEAADKTFRQFLNRYPVTAVINAGIAGALVDSIPPHTLCRVTAARDGDAPDSAPPIPCRTDRFPALPEATLATVAKPVFDDSRRAQLATHAMLVDMEGAIIAGICRERNIPCHLLKGVSDKADAQGRRNLVKNLPIVCAKLADALITEFAWLRHTHGPLKMLASFVRIEHTVFSLPLILAGAWLGAGKAMPSLRQLLLLALVGTGARTLGMAMNRIMDRDVDALNPRTRNRDLPSGRIRLIGAYSVAGAGLLAYLAGCAGLGPLCLSLSPIPLIPLIAYSLLKRFTSLCHFGIGLCLALGPAGAFLATSGALPVTPEVLLLSLFTFTWISAFDIIYALQDVAFDRAHGVHSLPARIGTTPAQATAAVVHLVSAASVVVIWWLLGGRWLSAGAMVATLGALVAAYWPSIPLPVRFFPISAIAGIGGAMVVLLGGFR